MSMYRCVLLYLVPIPYDPNSVYMCLGLLSNKALGIEESEYVYIYICVDIKVRIYFGVTVPYAAK